MTNEEIIKPISRHMEYPSYIGEWDVCDAMDDARKDERERILASPEEYGLIKDEWIDVKKELPDINEKTGQSENVLAFQELYGPVVGWFDNNVLSWRVAHYKADSLPIKVTHWRNLPTPPIK